MIDDRTGLLRKYLKETKGLNDRNVDLFIKEYEQLSEKDKSELIYEAVGKEIYKENPVDIETFINDPYYLGDIYGGILFKIWRELLKEIYPAPFCKKYDEVILSVATRCFGKGTEILMYDGTTKKVEDIVVGDKVMGPDSQPRNVLSLARGREMLYRVTPKKGGNSFICNASHKLALKYNRRHAYAGRKIDVEVKEFLNFSENKKKYLRMYHSEAIEYPKKELLIDPYIFGSWIGDGLSDSMRIVTTDTEILEAWKEFYNNNVDNSKYRFHCRVLEKPGKMKQYYPSIGINERYTPNEYLRYLKGIIEKYGHKRIPIEYLTSSIEDRKALFAGIIDTDGYCDKRGAKRVGYRVVSTKYEDLAEDYATLARSLGYRATVKRREKKLKYKNGDIYVSFDVNVSGDFSGVPFKLERKTVEGTRKVFKDYSTCEFTIEEIGEGDYYGFEVDKDHKFLLPDYLVTCNSGKTTCVALGILYEMYLVTCMINPTKFLTGKATGNLVFAILSKDNATAVSQLGSDIYKGLSQAPCFSGVVRDKLSFSKLDKDGVQITDNMLLKAGSSLGTVIGTDLFVGAIDEANMPSPRVALENLVEYRMRIYKEMLDRRSATLSKAPKMSGILWLTSSPTDEGDVLGERIQEVRDNGIPNVLIRDNIARWEAREEATDETFQFFLGSDTKDPCIVDEDIVLKPEEWERVIEVPNTTEYYNQFRIDPYSSIQNIAGRRTMPETALFNSVAVFDRVFHKENNIFTKNILRISTDRTLDVSSYLYDPDYFKHPNKPECFRYIHLDMAYSGDRFGLASVYSDRVKYKSEEDGHEISRRKYYVDFCLGVVSPNKEKVDIVKVLEFIYSLKEKGYPLKLVTTDNHQGELARQVIAKHGVKTDYLSIEKDKNIYLNLKNVIITESMEGFINPELMKELRGLRESQKKIEKGKGYTDDMSDALAGALWSCSQDRFFKTSNETISEIISQTGQMYQRQNQAVGFSNIARQVNGNKPNLNLGFRYFGNN